MDTSKMRYLTSISAFKAHAEGGGPCNCMQTKVNINNLHKTHKTNKVPAFRPHEEYHDK